jgi:RNA polymerase sigma factor (sigma-70 family)
MTGKEFYRFITSEDGVGHFFIDDGETVLESTKTDYRKWRKEVDHSDYLAEQAEGILVISLYGNEVDSGGNGEEIIADITVNAEESAIRNIRINALRRALRCLPVEDYQFVRALYLENMTERSMAKKIGVSQVAVHKRKKRILEDLKFLVIKLEKSSQ